MHELDRISALVSLVQHPVDAQLGGVDVAEFAPASSSLCAWV
ncbi:hypothetical protein [Streptomyces niveus]